MKSREPTQLWITKGATVSHNGRDYVILSVADINLVFAKEVGSDEKVLLKLGDIGPPTPVGANDVTLPAERDPLTITSEEWEIAETRRAHIEPLIGGPSHHYQALAQKIAGEAGVSRATVYRWVADFRHTRLLSSLLPNQGRRGRKGEKRLADEVEAIIKDVLENFHEGDQKPSTAKTIVEIHRRCNIAELAKPAINTIRARIAQRDGRTSLKKRKGEAAAHDQYDPIKSSIPDAEWPLSIVQIDHTLLPVIIVDDVYRKSIRRAWITLAIDVNTRMCLGMYLSLDPPSAMSAGMCISHSILPKEKWMSSLGVTTTDWPCWGVMGALHMDNAKEFRGDLLRVACKEYDIDIHLRPVKKPRYGAHIERLMGTVSEGLKGLKGATFSGPAEKGEYDAEGNACLTFSELEKWLVLFFAAYHRNVHAGIGTTPLNKWREGLLGVRGKPGRGLPARQLNEEKLRIVFMPFEERTVQNYGVLFDLHYYHDVLRPWINAPDPKFPRHSRTFRFHRDPRDISLLYFFDEISLRYCAIPYRDTSLPPCSIWEYREAKRLAKAKGISPDDEKAVFVLLTEMRQIEVDAAEKSKASRRAVQRRTEHDKARKVREKELPTASKPAPTGPPPVVRGYDPAAVKPLDGED
ncbi:MAG: DDE-type integrase/transposase/recombinase [Betaproteobacteria bacterium]|nr:DDE-type integrase/transposase/recombinase [Betaproteobacteria bacterium]